MKLSNDKVWTAAEHFRGVLRAGAAGARARAVAESRDRAISGLDVGLPQGDAASSSRSASDVSRRNCRRCCSARSMFRRWKSRSSTTHSRTAVSARRCVQFARSSTPRASRSSRSRWKSRRSPTRSAVYQVNRMLVQVMEHGTRPRRARADSAGHRRRGQDRHVIRLSRQLVRGLLRQHLAVVWIGYDDNSPTGLTGSSGSLPVWSRLMRSIGTTSWSAPLPEGLRRRVDRIHDRARREAGCGEEDLVTVARAAPARSCRPSPAAKRASSASSASGPANGGGASYDSSDWRHGGCSIVQTSDRQTTSLESAGAGAASARCSTACAVPSPYQNAAPPPPRHAAGNAARPRHSPVSRRSTVEEPQPLPAPVVREPTLGAASRALVGQAQTQIASKNYAVAASSIERALRIEPDNPLLWIELGKVRQAEGNYVQAENMARKAVSMSVNAPRAQSSAWSLIAESFRARGKNIEAQEAQARCRESQPRVALVRLQPDLRRSAPAEVRLQPDSLRLPRRKIAKELPRRRFPRVREREAAALAPDPAAARPAPLPAGPRRARPCAVLDRRRSDRSPDTPRPARRTPGFEQHQTERVGAARKHEHVGGGEMAASSAPYL